MDLANTSFFWTIYVKKKLRNALFRSCCHCVHLVELPFKFLCLFTSSLHFKDELTATVFGMEEEQQGKDPSERCKSSHRAVLEKKLSIAERAVATNPSCVALQLERLRICQELWEPSLLTKEWKKLVSLQYLFLYATHLMFLVCVLPAELSS